MKEVMSIIEFCDAFLQEPHITEPQRGFLRMMKQNEKLRMTVKPPMMGYTQYKKVINGFES